MNLEQVEYLEQQFGDAESTRPDTYRETSTIEQVDESEGGWSITTDTGSGCFINRQEIASDIRSEVKIKKGDQITVHTYQGMRIAGFDLNGTRLYLKSERELNLDWALYRAQKHRMDAEVFERNQPKMDEDYEALPQVFKERIDRFRKNNPDFRTSYEGYEMFCCKQAVVFAEAAGEAVKSSQNKSEVDDFWASPTMLSRAASGGEPWEPPPEDEERKEELRWLFWWSALNSKAYDYDYKRLHKEMPGYDDGHSGNTFGAALMLARLYIESPEYVSKIHGALSPLVGSAAYGDLDPETGQPG